MNSLELPPALDRSPKHCFCGRRTVASHDFWYCSTKCARQDALYSLNNPQSHYRQVVQANVNTGAPEPRRMPFGSSPSAQHHPVKPLPPIPSTFDDQYRRGEAPFARHMAGLPANVGAPFVIERRDRPMFEALGNASSRARPAQRPNDHVLARVVPTIDSIGNDARKDRLALAAPGQSRRAAEENPERIFGHPFNPTPLPVGKKTHTNSQVTLRRSASFHDARVVEGQSPLMRMIEEMRKEMAESPNPRSFFDMEEDY